MLNKVFSFILLTVTIIANASGVKEQTRAFPYPGPVVPLLIMPPTSPTRHQLIWGIGITNQLNFESIVYGLVFKAQYYLPDAIEDKKPLKPDPITWPGLGFHPRPQIEGRVARDVGWDPVQQMKYENYTANIEVVSEEVMQEINRVRDEEKFEEMKMIPDDEVKGMTRWDLYTAMEEVVKRYQLGDRECVLRAICEAAEIPFTHESGIFGELVQLLLSPSTSTDRIKRNSDNEYLFAEHIGRSHGRCEHVFKSCKVSIIELFTGSQDSLVDETMD